MSLTAIIASKDKSRFAKCGLSNLLDLALKIPLRYEDRTLAYELHIGAIQVFDVEVFNVRFTPKVLQMQLRLLDSVVDGVVFAPKPFHKLKYQNGVKLFVLGKVELDRHKLTIKQPKIIDPSGVGGVHLQYESTIIKNLAKQYISIPNLQACGLDDTTSKHLMALHHPDESTLKLCIKYGLAHPKMTPYLEALKYTELYNYLYQMRTKKRTFDALHAFDAPKMQAVLEQWQMHLAFDLTADQKQAIDDIKHDLAHPTKATRRMVVGDVGCGKSMVIFASALMAYPRKSALMVPTGVLARQLFEEAQKILPKHMAVDLITTDTKAPLAHAHLVIGTHALLYAPKILEQVALVMIDEQHRFGSAQRQAIEAFGAVGKKRPHFVQFSATPIPRTMAMIESQLIDFSFIKMTPFPKDIDTTIIGKAQFPKLLDHLRQEFDRGHQAIIVYPLVEESQHIDYMPIEQAKAFWIKRFDHVFVTHGKDKNKEQVLQDFAQQGHLLLATTLIEVGISLPKLSTIVIVGAERLGLATLHQLRGRVSRNGLKGYCYLFTNLDTSPRLEEFANLTSGFDVADLDLKFRQGGDVMGGVRQSGKSFVYASLVDDEPLIKKANKTIEGHLS